MYVYKSLTNQDIITSPQEINKTWDIDFSQNTGNEVYVDRKIAIYNSNLYNSIKHLYYSNYIYGVNGEVSLANLIEYNLDGTTSGNPYSTNYYNFLSTTLNPQRILPESNIGVISISKMLFGDHIKPKSLTITSPSLVIKDDGDGILFIIRNDKRYNIGNVIYEHGIIIIRPGTIKSTENPNNGEGGLYGSAEYGYSIYGSTLTIDEDDIIITDNDIIEIINNTNVVINFKNSYTLYQTLYKCSIENNEFNVTLNPSVMDENGTAKHFTKNNTFTPYVTQIGLYNDNHELMAVAKLSKPLPQTKDSDMNIIIKIDNL